MKIFISPQTKISVFFLILTLILGSSFLFIFFFNLSGVEIVVKTKPYNLETSFKLEVNPSDFKELKIFEIEKEAEKEFTPKTKVTFTGISLGEVKIINNSSNDQTLVATTRLLSPENLLFRLTERVLVKAKGETKAKVKADKEGEEYKIGPSKFTIPGLSPGLQKLIYAESEKPMSASSRESGLILPEDLETAKKTLKNQLYENILEEIKKKLPEKNLQIITKSEILSEKSDAQVNEEKEKFKVHLKLKVQALALERDKLLQIAQKKLLEQIKEDEVLVSLEEKSLSCLLEKLETAKKEGTISVALRAEVRKNQKAKIFDKEKIKGFSPEEIKNYFKSFDEVQDAKIYFFPPFIQKIPKNLEKIRFKVI